MTTESTKSRRAQLARHFQPLEGFETLEKDTRALSRLAEVLRKQVDTPITDNIENQQAREHLQNLKGKDSAIIGKINRTNSLIEQCAKELELGIFPYRKFKDIHTLSKDITEFTTTNLNEYTNKKQMFKEFAIILEEYAGLTSSSKKQQAQLVTKEAFKEAEQKYPVLFNAYRSARSITQTIELACEKEGISLAESGRTP